ncbi:MAG TPA: S9 family peptidase [Polyangiaceae bacterium LLY-WYZ-15_(1-7)]|nr:hypothetical protein [Myxococcales bacterium]MAT28573.1 hypothetical protein [Sandaracinus sp.]HJK92639.1 S9 family peptidase [Polyangiaceae bacterium LLY-WYZ-15_(1-7)]MBJ74788.1 hypothetical protein [Sandaracinus sp.]HJL01618.1 S9 family peptidase [Polyangiaceae bacterium LLY-WYZ-15_(1-7)]
MITPERLTQLGRLAEVVPAPDGSWLAAAIARLDEDDAAYVHDLWRIPLDGGVPRKLTRGPWDDRSPRFRRDGSLCFLSNRAHGKKPEEGEEKRAQVWVLPEDGGDPRRLTDEPLGVRDFRLAANADVMVVLADVWPGVAHEEQRAHAKEVSEKGPSLLHYTRMPVRYWDRWEPAASPHLIAYTSEGEERRDLTPRAHRAHRDVGWDLSADGERVVIGSRETVHADRIEDVWLAILSVKGAPDAEPIELGRGRRSSHQAPRFSPDGLRVATARTTRREGELYAHDLVLYDLEGRERVLDEGWDRWATPECWVDWNTLLARYDDQGNVRLARVDAAGKGVEKLPFEGSYGGAHPLPEGQGFVGVGHTLLQPPRAFRLVGSVMEWLADPSGWEPDEVAEVEVEDLAFAAPDPVEEGGEPATVRGFLLKPPGEGPHPTLLWIHGGPISQWSDGWHWRWNPLVLVQAGYAVALPNPRGSTGEGHAFTAGIWGNRWGEACYRDLMAVSDGLAAREDVDEGRLVAMGGSFGGYMTNYLGGRTERFAALVSHAGLWDLRAFYGVTDVPSFFGMQNASTPWEGEIDKHSPHRNVGSWESPVLILHGSRDYRVPVGEALAMFEALQAHGVESELAVFPDENHWILKPRNARAWYRTVIDFLNRKLA